MENSFADINASDFKAKEYLYKILVIGDYGVGKTAIIRRYAENKFCPHYKLTIGVDFSTKVIQYDANTSVTAQLWDIAGHERYGFLTRVYYKYAHAAIIVFDLTRAASFDSVLKWLTDVKEKVILSNSQHVPILLLANKCDLEEQYDMELTHINDFCQLHNVLAWYKTSAKENITIDEAMLYLITHIMQTQSDAADIRPCTPGEIKLETSLFTKSNNGMVWPDSSSIYSQSSPGSSSSKSCCSS